MAKRLKIIYPGLRAKMAFAGESTEEISKIIGISDDTTRRRLRGQGYFDLEQIKKLTDHYECTFDDLFGLVDKVEV